MHNLFKNEIEIKNEYIGLIPIRDFLFYLDAKYYNKQRAINYVKDIYNLNIENEVNTHCWDFQSDIYDIFNNKHPSKKKDDGSRKWFGSQGRNRFARFLKMVVDLGHDYYFPISKESEVHHIYPLTHSKDNSINNLISINKFNHDLLHENPLQHIRECNFKAVDHLYYLYNGGFCHTVNSYGIDKLNMNLGSTNGVRMAREMFRAALRIEMYNFYDYLKDEYKSE